MTDLDVIVDGKNQSVTQIHYSESFNGSLEDGAVLIISYYKKDEDGKILFSNGNPIVIMETKFKIRKATFELERL